MPGDGVRQLDERRADAAVVGERDQPAGQLRDPRLWQPREGSKHRQPGQVPDRVLDHLAAVPAGNVVEDDPDEVELRVELPHADDERGRGLGAAAQVDDQDGRRSDQVGDLCRAAREARLVRRLWALAMAVEDPGGALDDRAVGIANPVHERPHHAVAAEHPGVEVAAGAATGAGEMGAVELVGTDLERLHRAPPPAQRAHQPQGHRRLARAGAEAGDDDAGDGRLLRHCCSPGLRGHEDAARTWWGGVLAAAGLSLRPTLTPARAGVKEWCCACGSPRPPATGADSALPRSRPVRDHTVVRAPA